jgi:hypothetical protein
MYLCVPYDCHNKQRFFPLNSINRMVFVIETKCVSSEVRTEFLNRPLHGHTKKVANKAGERIPELPPAGCHSHL